jgi:CubicO group peptidase (beta-lactamase class C family)
MPPSPGTELDPEAFPALGAGGLTGSARARQVSNPVLRWILPGPARRALLVPTLCAFVAFAGCVGEDVGSEGRARATSAAAAEPVERPPPTVGLDSILLEAAYARAATLPRLYSLLVARHGRLEREAYFNGATPRSIANIKSASKSVVSTLVGIAIEEGHLEGLDQPILDLLPEFREVNEDPRMASVTVGHLLAMQAGLQSTSSGNYGGWVSSGNWVRDALRRPFVEPPGGRMVYSTGNTHLLSAILTRATGQSTLAYARRALFEPLGITLAPWTRDPQGIFLGGNEMGLLPREMFVYGELYRNGGIHEGERLVSEAWIEDSWTQRGTSQFNGHGHGLGWWIREYRGHDVYFAWGHGGQYVFVVPDLELTVVTTSNPLGGRRGSPTRAIHDLVENVLIPAAERGGDYLATEEAGAPPA